VLYETPATNEKNHRNLLRLSILSINKNKKIFSYSEFMFRFILKDLSSPLPKTNTSKTQPSSSTITLTKTNQYLPKIKIQLYSVQVGLSTVFSCFLKVYANQNNATSSAILGKIEKSGAH